MRTAADLQRAAADAGLHVDWIEPVPVAGGGTELAAGMSFSDPWAAARLLVDLSEEDAADPVVQAWAYEMLSASADAIGESAGPRVSGALRDAVARTIHANVADQIKFVHEPKEKFQAARVTMQTREGDCDCHARLVYALNRAVGVPAEIVFFEGTDPDGQVVPVHAVTRVQDAGGTWQWAETTIGADFGEDPYAALDRLGADLPDEQNPFAQAGVYTGANGGIDGVLGFVTPSDVQARKDELNAVADSIDADVVNCPALDAGTVSAWNEFLGSWRTFYAVAPSFWNAGGQGRQTSDYADQISNWQDKLAPVCKLSQPKLPAQPEGDVLSVVKIVAIAAGVVSVALVAREAIKIAR